MAVTTDEAQFDALIKAKKARKMGLSSVPNWQSMKEPIWIMHEVEQYYLPYLFTVPEFQDKLQQWFPSRNVATVITRYLLHPSNEIWEDILDSFGRKNLLDYAVGLQIRWHGMSIDSALKCFDHQLGDEGTHFFLASLYSNLKDDLHARNPRWELTQKYQEGHEEHVDGQTHHALHDMWLMSMTDETVVSAHSTFGYLAMAIKGETCKMLSETAPFPCYYPASHEPCFHLATRLIKEKDVKPDLLIECEDFKGGLKLAL